MITQKNVRASNCFEFNGEHGDEKPTEGIGVNSLFHELDTGDDFYFDGTEWKAAPKSGGGGGGGDTGSALTNPYVISVRADVYNEPQAKWQKSNSPAFSANNVTVDISGNEVTVSASFFCVSDSDFAKIFSAKAPFSLVEKYENPEGFTGATSVAVVWGQEPYNITQLIVADPQHYTFVPQLAMESDSFYDTEHSPGIVTSDVIIVSINASYGVPQSIIAVVPESVKFRHGGVE